MKRGDVYYAELDPVVGQEQGGLRPVLVVQNDIGNRYSMTTIVAPLTTRDKPKLPTHAEVLVKGSNCVKGIVLMEQVRAISSARLISYCGALSAEDMEKADYALMVSLGLRGGREDDYDKKQSSANPVVYDGDDKTKGGK